MSTRKEIAQHDKLAELEFVCEQEIFPYITSDEIRFANFKRIITFIQTHAHVYFRQSKTDLNNLILNDRRLQIANIVKSALLEFDREFCGTSTNYANPQKQFFCEKSGDEYGLLRCLLFYVWQLLLRMLDNDKARVSERASETREDLKHWFYFGRYLLGDAFVLLKKDMVYAAVIEKILEKSRV